MVPTKAVAGGEAVLATQGMTPESRGVAVGFGPADFGSLDIHDPHQLGKLGEELAACYMEACGYAVCAQNHRSAYGEADIVCRRGNEVVLVEVKTRLGTAAYPEDAVTAQKVRRYRRITLDYLAKNEGAQYARFDVIAVNVADAHSAHLHHYLGLCSWEG